MTQNLLSPDLTVRDLNGWAKMQSGRLRLALGSDTGSHPAFVLAQAVKLAEEVGGLLAVSSGFGDQVCMVPAWRVDEEVMVSLAAWLSVMVA
jgi:hypothetical protein